MEYNKITFGKFISRPNRFISIVDIEGHQEIVHVKNTGRCKELLIPGVKVVLAKSDNPNRKTRYDLVTVEKNGLGLINIDSQAP
nr:DNA/RNA nuclease SfsA [Anaerovibrio sp.]